MGFRVGEGVTLTSGRHGMNQCVQGSGLAPAPIVNCCHPHEVAFLRPKPLGCEGGAWHSAHVARAPLMAVCTTQFHNISLGLVSVLGIRHRPAHSNASV